MRGRALIGRVLGFPCAHRALRAQRFVRWTEADLRAREDKAAAALAALPTPVRVQLSAAQADSFYERLVEDSERRTRNRRAQPSHPLNTAAHGLQEDPRRVCFTQHC